MQIQRVKNHDAGVWPHPPPPPPPPPRLKLIIFHEISVYLHLFILQKLLCVASSLVTAGEGFSDRYCHSNLNQQVLANDI